MILNSRQSSFLISLPPDFFDKKIVKKYTPYLSSLIMPYDNLEDFMVSTIQSVSFPSLDMKPVTQVRNGGKQQEYKNSLPIVDQFNRELTINFKLTDAFLNYFIFVDNALNYFDFHNIEPTNTQNSLGPSTRIPKQELWTGQYFDPIRLSLMSNEGHIVCSLVFEKPMIIGWSELNLSYSSNTPDFNTFSVKFKFFDVKIVPDFS
jgi:hypothetical protein